MTEMPSSESPGVTLSTLHIGFAPEGEAKGIAGLPQGCKADIFIYNDDRLKRIDSYQRLDVDGEMAVKAASRKGDKIVVAIVNPQTDSYGREAISSYEAFRKMTADLKLEDERAPLMSGELRIRAEDGNRYEMTLSPLLSEILVRSVRCDFSGTPYPDATLDNAVVYLANVNSMAELSRTEGFIPMAPINTEGQPDCNVQGMKRPEMLSGKIAGSIGSAGSVTCISLYCYPDESQEDSPGTPFTRLILAGDILGERYYYPININRGEFGPVSGTAGIGRNCRYVFDFVLKRTGTSSPLEPVNPETVEITCSVVPWEATGDTEIIF